MDVSRERLRLLDLPVFSSIDELANLIHISKGRLGLLYYRTDKFYKKYKIPKRNKGMRLIYQPSKELKSVQAWILRNVLDKLKPSPHATAFIKGKGLAYNVLPHRNNRYFITIDIENFFPSVSVKRILRLFNLIGYSDNAAYILTKLCTCDGKLPQGGVTSPALSNLVLHRLDRRLSGLTSRRNIVYTRYADDMIFSSNNRTVLNKSLKLFLNIIASEGFKPNPAKIKVMGPKIHCGITGLTKNSSEPQFGIGKNKKREMRAIMYSFIKNGYTESKFNSFASINGWLSYIKSIDENSFKQMNKYWLALQAPVKMQPTVSNEDKI